MVKVKKDETKKFDKLHAYVLALQHLHTIKKLHRLSESIKWDDTVVKVQERIDDLIKESIFIVDELEKENDL